MQCPEKRRETEELDLLSTAEQKKKKASALQLNLTCLGTVKI